MRDSVGMQSQLCSDLCLNYLFSTNPLLPLAEAKTQPFAKPWPSPVSAKHGAMTAFG